MANETSAEPSGNQRDNERVPTVASVEFGTELWPRKGVTRDISASGMFIETDANHPIESLVSFSVELDTPQGKMLIRCRGEVVRIEPRHRKVGIAVKITESTMVTKDIMLPPAVAESPAAAQMHAE